MARARFKGEVLSGHKQAAVEAPFDPAKKWGAEAASIRPGRRGYKVHGTLAGAPFQSVIVPRAKRFWVLIEREHLKAAGVSVGDSVAVSLEPVE